MEDFIKIGEIVKPQGVMGEVKVSPMTDDATRFLNLKEIYADGKTYAVLRAKVGGGAVFLVLKGVADRNAAELLRGKSVLIPRENAVELKENSYFIDDIIGTRVVCDGKVLGAIIDVFSSKTDVITVKGEDGKVLRFPFLKTLLVSMDVKAKIMTVDAKRLSEVCVYED